VLQHHVARSRVTWLSAFRRGILPVYSGHMIEILITKLFIDPVSHQPLNKALHSHIIRKFGPDTSVCRGSNMLSIRGICTFAPQRRRLCCQMFLSLDKYNTRGDGAKRHHPGFLADLSHGHCCCCLQGFPWPLRRYLLSVTTEQMATDQCMYSHALRQMYTYDCAVREIDCVRATVEIGSQYPSVWSFLSR